MVRYEESSWWSRNRSWALALGGCGGCLLLVVVGAVTLVVGGGAAIFTGIRSSAAYSEAVAQASSDPRVVALLGEPIETGWMVSGSINVTGSSGEADLAIPLSGPNGKATLYSVATKSAGEWRFDRLEVEPEGGGQRIDLLAGVGEGAVEDELAPVA